MNGEISMHKKALLALLMAMTLLLSSCALIVKDQAVDDATEIIRLGDKVVTKAEVKAQIEYELDSMASLYAMYGLPYDVTDPANIESARDGAIADYKKDLVLTAKATELGLDQLTEEEEETVKTKAQESYDGAIEYLKTYELADSGLEGEELDKAAAEKLTEYGYSMDTYLESARKSVIDEKLREYIVQDVTVTDEEIQAEYDSRVEADKTTYAESAGSYAAAANNGTTIYYAPAGVRRVKQILTKFKEEDQTAITEAKQKVTDANTAVTAAEAKITAADELLAVEGISDEEKAQAEADKAEAQKALEEAQAELEAANKALDAAVEAAFAAIDADADAILEQLAAGADWETLMAEKNQDPGMTTHPEGYAVSADMTTFDSAFVQAAMALENAGDYSGKIRGTSYGYYIIRYEGDVAEGPIAFDAVKDTISSTLLTTNKDNKYNETVEEWIASSGIKVDLNALND